MTTTSIENNKILTLSQEHTFILKNLIELENCANIPEPKERLSMLKKCVEKFEISLTRHTRVEELIIFQTALLVVNTKEIVNIVLTLQKQHGIMETLVSAINADIWHTSENSLKDMTRIFDKIDKLIKLIKLHAATEVRDLFPKLSNNPRCMTMIENMK